MVLISVNTVNPAVKSSLFNLSKPSAYFYLGNRLLLLRNILYSIQENQDQLLLILLSYNISQHLNNYIQPFVIGLFIG